jgi:hypothetical protein
MILLRGTKVFLLNILFSLGHIEPLFHIVNLIAGLTNFLRLEVLSREAADRRLKNGASFRDGMSHWV